MRTMLLFPELAPLALAALLAWTGAAKLLRKNVTRQAADTALARLLPGPRAAALALRGVGGAELVVAAALLAAPLSPLTVAATVALGGSFSGYLGYAKATAPQSSCGCASARHTPISWRSFARAGLVAAIGAGCAAARVPWWSAGARYPAAAVGVVVVVAAALAGVSSELDNRWLLPLRRARVRLFGHPLAGRSGQAGPVPLAATMELLEESLAWQTMAPIVRSALVDHWDSDGWRILRYTGVHDGPAGPRPVSVVFALDANASRETVAEPIVRVGVVDDESMEPVVTPSLHPPRRPLLPLAAPA